MYVMNGVHSLGYAEVFRVSLDRAELVQQWTGLACSRCYMSLHGARCAPSLLMVGAYNESPLQMIGHLSDPGEDVKGEDLS